MGMGERLRARVGRLVKLSLWTAHTGPWFIGGVHTRWFDLSLALMRPPDAGTVAKRTTVAQAKRDWWTTEDGSDPVTGQWPG